MRSQLCAVYRVFARRSDQLCHVAPGEVSIFFSWDRIHPRDVRERHSTPFLDVSGSSTRKVLSGPVRTLTWSFSTATARFSVRGSRARRSGRGNEISTIPHQPPERMSVGEIKIIESIMMRSCKGSGIEPIVRVCVCMRFVWVIIDQ